MAASRCCLWALAIIALALFLFGIFLLLPFPLAVFPALVKSQLHLSHAEDGSYPTLTHYWSKLPANAYYYYYMFNITNRDEVMYENAMPSFIEIGPYTYKEWEFKEGIRWFDNDNKIYFRNNKSFAYEQEKSGDFVTYDDLVTLPNAAYQAVLSLINQNRNLPQIKVNAFIMDLLTILMGEGPMRTVPVAGVLFDSYADPFIELVNSNLTKMLATDGKFLGMTLPSIKYMGYFPKYNHSNDEDYTAFTGKSDVFKTAQIISWAGNASLDWWGDAYSRDLAGAGDGSFNKAQLKKTDKIKMYQSYACRAFHLTYQSDDSVSGIKAYVYKLENYDYDSTLELNKGYRYENTEKVDYYPTWPCGVNRTYNPSGNCATIDCSLRQYWCDSCCNGTHYRDTVFLPPGMVPLRCLPGQKIRVPFGAFISPPHFLQSPPEVTNSMRGIEPDVDKHEPAVFYINPLSGSTLKAMFRLQLSVPIYRDRRFVLASNIVNAMAPSFWVDIQINLKQYAINYLRTVNVVIPGIALGLGIGLIVVTLSGLLLTLMIVLRRRRARSSSSFKVTHEAPEEATKVEEAENWKF